MCRWHRPGLERKGSANRLEGSPKQTPWTGGIAWKNRLCVHGHKHKCPCLGEVNHPKKDGWRLARDSKRGRIWGLWISVSHVVPYESRCECESATFCCRTVLGCINELILYKTHKQFFHSGSGRCISWHSVLRGQCPFKKGWEEKWKKSNSGNKTWSWWWRRRGSLVQETERQSEFWHFLVFGWLTLQSCQSSFSIAFVSFLMSVFLQFNKVTPRNTDTLSCDIMLAFLYLIRVGAQTCCRNCENMPGEVSERSLGTASFLEAGSSVCKRPHRCLDNLFLRTTGTWSSIPAVTFTC